MEKGILTPEQEKILSSKLDDVVKLKGVLEIIDGYIFKSLITFLDDIYIDKLSEEFKIQLAELADAIIKEDIELAEKLAGDIISKLVDIPGLDEDAEGLLFKGIIQIIVAAVIRWVEKEKQMPVKLGIWGVV